MPLWLSLMTLNVPRAPLLLPSVKATAKPPLVSLFPSASLACSVMMIVLPAWAPKHVPAELWQLANKRGPDKLMWASDHPLLSLERCAREGWEVPLTDAAKRGYLRDNVLKVFKFD